VPNGLSNRLKGLKGGKDERFERFECRLKAGLRLKFATLPL
jgi:hypothetical protein